MALKVTHTQAEMVVFGSKCHTYSSRYGCVTLVDMAASATHTPADVFVLWLYNTKGYGCKCRTYSNRHVKLHENMVINVTLTLVDMVVLSLKIWL